MHGQVDMGPEARITGSHWSAVGAGSLASDGLGMREACSQDAAQRSAARTARVDGSAESTNEPAPTRLICPS